jgi:hypothetical protein
MASSQWVPSVAASLAPPVPNPVPRLRHPKGLSIHQRLERLTQNQKVGPMKRRQHRHQGLDKLDDNLL